MFTGKILLTGAAGRVASILRTRWKDRYELRLADIKEVSDLKSSEEYKQFDMNDPDSCANVCKGIHTVVHLAADPGNGDFFDSLLPRNIIGPYNLFLAAANSGCKRIIFTSSIYAVRGHGPKVPPVEPTDPIHPQGLYGATKCWGEALGRVISAENEISFIVVRLGNPSFDPSKTYDNNEPSYLISPDDTATLFSKCIEAKDIKFSIVHGSSLHKNMWLGMNETKATLDFTPQHGTSFN